MNHLSTDIGNQIGALELGGTVEGYGDDALERSEALSPTGVQFGCQTRLCAGDDALEAAGTSLGPSPTTPPSCLGIPTMGCRIDDAMLEAAGASTAQPLPTQYVSGCGAPTSVLCHP